MSAGTREKVNILLVDDQPGKLLTYEAILGELDENLLKAASAREAFDILLRTEVAVVLVDVCMPDLDGFELASMIRQHPRFQSTAIILISAVLINDIDRMRGYTSGAMDYLPVPVVPEILRAKVAIFLDLYRKSRELESLNRELERRVRERTAALEGSTAMLRASEERLRESDSRKDQFLAILAHELRNPVAPICNSVRVLKMRGPADPEVQWSLDVIDRQVNHLTRLIDDLLDVSRISRGKLELRRSRVTLAEVVESALESSRPLIEQFGHHLTIELPTRPVFLEADLVRLSQVFMNLLNNSAKYTPKGGRIGLVAEVEPPGSEDPVAVVVRVNDSGVGIPAEKLPNLFEMFVQLDDAPGRSNGGLGIGLALVRHLVEMHGGEVEASSAGPALGSEFAVRLPTIAGARMPAAIDTAALGEGTARIRRRILVVDDMPDNAASLTVLLRQLGHQVETAYGGLEALATVQRLRPQIVLLDLGMPDLDGLQVCRRIRQFEWGSEIILVALTGWGQEQDRRRAYDAGFDAHLVKPLDHVALEALLAEFGTGELPHRRDRVAPAAEEVDAKRPPGPG
ncbi:MAG: response regulator [Thermoanaerobaculia bacterium]